MPRTIPVLVRHSPHPLPTIPDNNVSRRCPARDGGAQIERLPPHTSAAPRPYVAIGAAPLPDWSASLQDRVHTTGVGCGQAGDKWKAPRQAPPALLPTGLTQPILLPSRSTHLPNKVHRHVADVVQGNDRSLMLPHMPSVLLPAPSARSKLSPLFQYHSPRVVQNPCHLGQVHLGLALRKATVDG